MQKLSANRLRGALVALAPFWLVGCVATAKPSAVAKAPAAAAPSAAETPAKPDLPVREELPYEAREMLSERMLRHGKEMTAMMVGVLLLEYDLVHMLASDLAEEPKLGRPAPNERGTLNALLPAGFFTYQDALATSAGALAKAAEDKHDKRLAEAFGKVAEACVGCHSTYLHEQLNFEHEEPGPALAPCEMEGGCD